MRPPEVRVTNSASFSLCVIISTQGKPIQSVMDEISPVWKEEKGNFEPPQKEKGKEGLCSCYSRWRSERFLSVQNAGRVWLSIKKMRFNSSAAFNLTASLFMNASADGATNKFIEEFRPCLNRGLNNVNYDFLLEVQTHNAHVFAIYSFLQCIFFLR